VEKDLLVCVTVCVTVCLSVCLCVCVCVGERLESGGEDLSVAVNVAAAADNKSKI